MPSYSHMGVSENGAIPWYGIPQIGCSSRKNAITMMINHGK
jgi:hypothetical protein